MRENVEPAKYPWEKIGDSWSTHEKKFETLEIPTEKTRVPQTTHDKKLRTHEIPSKKKLVIHELPTKARWHDGTRPTRHTMAHDPLKVAHSYMGKYVGNVMRKQNSISYSGEELTELYKE